MVASNFSEFGDDQSWLLFLLFGFLQNISPAVSFSDLNFMWSLLSVPPLINSFISLPRWDAWQMTFP